MSRDERTTGAAAAGKPAGAAAAGKPARAAAAGAAAGAPGRAAPPTGGPVKAPAKAPAFLFGMGIGGFVDGIVLHQLLQWHHMLSHTEGGNTKTVAGLELNTLADGIFHGGMWVLVVAAAALTVRARRQGRLSGSWRFHTGLVLCGWGVFNIAEGLVNHELLQIHHVRDDLGGPLSWDVGFLAVSVVLAVAGWLLFRGSPTSGHIATAASR